MVTPRPSPLSFHLDPIFVFIARMVYRGGHGVRIRSVSGHFLEKRRSLLLSRLEQLDKKLEEIEKDTDRDFFMDGKDAVEYGMVDKIMEKKKVD